MSVRLLDRPGRSRPGAPEDQRDAQHLLVERVAVEHAAVVEQLLAVVGGERDQHLAGRRPAAALRQEAGELGVVVGEGAGVEPAQPLAVGRVGGTRPCLMAEQRRACCRRSRDGMPRGEPRAERAPAGRRGCAGGSCGGRGTPARPAAASAASARAAAWARAALSLNGGFSRRRVSRRSAPPRPRARSRGRCRRREMT